MTAITIIGNLTADPELRFTPAGKAVANFTVAVSKRIRDGNDWKDGPPSFFRCSLWDAQAEHLVESLHRGNRVMVVGEISQREYEKDGEKRSTFEVRADEVGASLKWDAVTTVKAGKGGGPRPAAAADGDPWGVNTGEAPF